jgi:hypothetical protein
MTIDFLLTAKDLPGWNGSFPAINFTDVITKSLMELSSGMYGDQRIGRELAILSKIAELHGLSDFFHKKVKKTKCYKKRDPFTGHGISTDKIYLDGDDYHIKNIFDASYAVQNIYQVYSDLTFTSVTNTISRSLTHRLRAIRGESSSFPLESEWK